ncbi:hypothetical protein GCM10027436_82980 [Actinophytocola sediminis]
MPLVPPVAAVTGIRGIADDCAGISPRVPVMDRWIGVFAGVDGTMPAVRVDAPVVTDVGDVAGGRVGALPLSPSGTLAIR